MNDFWFQICYEFVKQKIMQTESSEKGISIMLWIVLILFVSCISSLFLTA